MRRWTSIIAYTLLLLHGCGDPTDRPEDCTPNEYFDEARKLCFTCPAVPAPSCEAGCGFTLSTDDRGCPAVECVVGDDCTTCPPTEWFDSTLRCAPCDGVMSCPEDAAPVRRISDGSCTLVCP